MPRPLRYSINVTLDGCCDHRAMIADEELHRHARVVSSTLDRVDWGAELVRGDLGTAVQPRLVGHGPTLFAGLSKRIDLKLVSRLEFDSGAVAMRYEPTR